jgi:hypothetical protein
MKKRGQFFITILVLIAMIIFSISVLMYRTSQSFEDRVSELSAFERLNNLDLSTQNVLRHMFDDYSGMNISVSSSVSGPSIMFEDNLPSIHSSLNISLNSFKNYTESSFDYINLSIEPVKTNLPLLIKSYGLLYNHTNSNKITITNPNNNINTIDVYVYATGSTISAETRTLASGSSINFSYAVVDGLGNSRSSTSIPIASNLDTWINVTTNNGVVSIIKKSSSDPANPNGLEIIAPMNNAIVKTTLTLNDNGNKLDVRYPQGIINISFPSYGISKLGDARIR